MFSNTEIQTPEKIKACCAAVYESDWARLLLGDSFHPGGLALTERLGDMLELAPGQRVLDAAAGAGTSAIYLAQQFDCRVIGLDYGKEAVAGANAAADDAGLVGKVHFEQGDAERLPFLDSYFDAILIECAFCTFPNKATAAAELARVLKPGGSLGLSDLTRSGPLPPELDTLLAWMACIADARPVEEYERYLEAAGLVIETIEAHDEVLAQSISDVRGKLLGAELLVKLKKIALPGGDFDQARVIARSAAAAVEAGELGYILMVARREA